MRSIRLRSEKDLTEFELLCCNQKTVIGKKLYDKVIFNGKTFYVVEELKVFTCNNCEKCSCSSS